MLPQEKIPLSEDEIESERIRRVLDKRNLINPELKKQQYPLRPDECFSPFSPKPPDMVNLPPHYRQGDVEVIDQMIILFGTDDVITYCKVTAFKYRMRAGYKGDAGEDISKAKWYEDKAKKLKATHV